MEAGAAWAAREAVTTRPIRSNGARRRRVMVREPGVRELGTGESRGKQVGVPGLASLWSHAEARRSMRWNELGGASDGNYCYYMKRIELKVARIGNSRGVRLPAGTLA